VPDWQVGFLALCADAPGAALGESAFGSGPAIWVGKREVAHFDGERTIDIRLTKAVIRSRRPQLKSDERVTLRPSTSDWIEVEVRSDADAEWASALIRDAIEANLPTAPPGLPPEGADLERRGRFH
jgi:hypothetical protein